jgi:glycosyltransferase involved in cell wall biosynthesis
MPTFNRAALLRGAVEHCLAQTHADLEMIIVDDGSTDATLELVRGLGDDRIMYVRHERNRGLPEALNTGFRHATGAYLTWSSDDDRLAPTAIAELVGVLQERRDIDFVYADYWVIDVDGELVRQVEVGPPETLVLGNCVGICRLYRRAVYEVIGDYDPSTRLAEDYDYWLRVSRRFRMAPLHKRLAYRRDHPGSLTSRFRVDARRVAERVKLEHGCTTPAAYRRALDWLDVWEALASGDRVAALRRGLRATLRDPRHLTNRLLPSLLLEAMIGTRAREGLRTIMRGRPKSARLI